MNYRTAIGNLVIVLTTVAATTVCALAHATPNWPQFRGADARGIADGQGLPTKWSATENVAWTVDIPGRAWSSPVVWGDKIFVTTVISTGEMEDVKKGLYFGGNRDLAPGTVHYWKVYCLDLKTGAQLWDKVLHEGEPPFPVHVKNSFASETPITDGDHVYAYFGNIGVFCLDFDGNTVWEKRFEPQKTRFKWGTASSPVLHEDILFLQRDFMKDSHVLALDKNTGDELWRSEREEFSNWSTPYVWEHDERTEFVTAGSKAIRSYGLDGELLWTLTGMSTITIATPYENDGLLYISSGYVGDKLRPVYAIRPGASGDITLVDDETSNEWIAWSDTEAGPYNPSTILYKDRLYVLYDRGQMACYDATTGAVVYEQTKIPGGRHFTTSPWAYDGKIFCLNEDGETFVIAAKDEFELLHTNALQEDDMGMATPAMAGNSLLIRTAPRIYCVRTSDEAGTEAN